MGVLSSLAAATALVVAVVGYPNAPIVGAAGQTNVIGGWNMQSTAKVSNDMVVVSQPGFDVSSWYRVGSHGTVMVSSNHLPLCPELIL